MSEKYHQDSSVFQRGCDPGMRPRWQKPWFRHGRPMKEKGGSWLRTGAQEELLLKLADTGVPTVVVLVNGRPLAIGALQENDGTVRGQVTITNTGDCDGDEIVQLYIYDVAAGCARPVKELKRFWKLHLSPGQSETIYFSIPVSELGYYNRKLEYVTEPGDFQIFTGPDSSRGLMETFTVNP